MKRHTLLLLTLVATLSVAACGASTAVADTLSDAEANELANALMATTFGSVTGTNAPAATAPAAASVSGSTQVDLTVSCPGGGGIAVHATLAYDVDSQTNAGTVDYSMTQAHAGCVVTSDGGVTFTLDGAPNVSVDLLAESDGLGSSSFFGSLDGAVDWSTDGRHGRCSISVEFSGSQNTELQTGEFSLSGSVCQVSIQTAGSIT